MLGAPPASEAVTAPASPPALGPFPFSHRCRGSRERRFSGAISSNLEVPTFPRFHWNPDCNPAPAAYLLKPTRKDTMRQSDIFRENAENCAHLAETANNEPAYLRFKRMEAAWRALADEQDWLDGEVSPAPIPGAPKSNGSARAKSERR